MARIAETQLEDIRQRVDIAELIREYVPDLKRSGRNLKARCPFHQEKTPSFMVNPEKQIYHCFGCQEGGDAFAFLMKMENLSFTEAVEKLARRAGVTIAKSEESLSPRERESIKLREVLAFAEEFYRKLLAQSPEADAARRYLDKRGMNQAMRERFGIGYALSDGGSFLQAALKKGFAPEILGKAGLVSVLEGAGRYRDFFRGRILFPIRNTKGETAGFGARAMGDAMPKYLNSPDTIMFSKGRTLYGLFEGLSEVRKSRRAILLEGYMDVIALHQFGFVNACAPLGTAVTPDHAVLLKRYAEEIVLVFDPDDAGASAALRGADLLLENGFAVRIATVPRGLDPDELLHKDGAKALERCLADAKDLPDFQTNWALSKSSGPITAEAKDKIATAVLASIAKAQSEVLKDEWLRRLAQRLGLNEESLRFQLKRANTAGRPVARPERTAASRPERRSAGVLPALDRTMLQALFRVPRAALDEGKISDSDLESASAKRIFGRLRESLEAGIPDEKSSSWIGTFLQSLPAEDAAAASALLVDDSLADENPTEELGRLVTENRLLRRYWELDAEMAAIERGGGAKTADTAKEYRELLKRLSDLRLMDRIHTDRRKVIIHG